ncbi:MAG: lipid A-modifier LpxR family protein [Yoonia sp.]
MRFTLAIAAVISTFATSAFAEGRETIGFGRIFNNDFFGDQADRLQTGSNTFSIVRGRQDYAGDEAFGDLLEYQLRAQIISLSGHAPAPGDRPYVGALTMGVAMHFDFQGTQLTLGSEMTAIGPQTGLSAFQIGFHDTFNMPEPRFTDDQLGNAFFLGGVAQNDLMLRDVVTGELYRGTQDEELGVSLLFGADIAKVFDSAYLPADMGYTVSETRSRARAGVFWQFAEDAPFFYGATYLSEEFEGQHKGQVV